MVFVLGRHLVWGLKDPGVASPGSGSLASANDETEYAADGGDNPITHQQEFFKTTDHGVNAVFEIGLNPGRRVVGSPGMLGLGIMPNPLW